MPISPTANARTPSARPQALLPGPSRIHARHAHRREGPALTGLLKLLLRTWQIPDLTPTHTAARLAVPPTAMDTVRPAPPGVPLDEMRTVYTSKTSACRLVHPILWSEHGRRCRHCCLDTTVTPPRYGLASDVAIALRPWRLCSPAGLLQCRTGSSRRSPARPRTLRPARTVSDRVRRVWAATVNCAIRGCSTVVAMARSTKECDRRSPKCRAEPGKGHGCLAIGCW
jgi:hypothetical protein